MSNYFLNVSRVSRKSKNKEKLIPRLSCNCLKKVISSGVAAAAWDKEKIFYLKTRELKLEYLTLMIV